MNNVLFIVFGMLVVTYIPRLIPFMLVSDRKLPRRVERFLEFVPYAALGALIIPGAFSAVEGHALVGIAGLLFAGIYSYTKGGIIVSVIGAIGIVYFILLM